MSRLSVVHKACGILLIVSLTITGCLGSRDWEYPPPPDRTYLNVTADQKVAGSLVVVPLDDKRGTEVREQYWAAVIPFVPHASTVYDRPETVSSPAPLTECPLPRHAILRVPWRMKFERRICFLP